MAKATKPTRAVKGRAATSRPASVAKRTGKPAAKRTSAAKRGAAGKPAAAPKRSAAPKRTAAAKRSSADRRAASERRTIAAKRTAATRSKTAPKRTAAAKRSSADRRAASERRTIAAKRTAAGKRGAATKPKTAPKRTAASKTSARTGVLARNVRRLGRLEMPGGGQVVVQGGYAYVGHMQPPHGTSIVDVRDPRKPRLVSRIELPDLHSHTHKVRVVGDLMVTNSEMYDRHFLRQGWEIAAATARMERELGRAPSDGDLAGALGVQVHQLPALRAAAARGYPVPGFRIYDISDKARPRLLHFEKTWGVGVHRFDMDARYAYISTEKDGFHGNILCIYDLANPERPQPVADWWMPGQHLAAGDKPHWRGYRNRLHHGLRHGDRIYAACWHAGLYVLDVSDIRSPRAIAHHTYHPPVVEPTHTVMPVPHPVGGREVALVIDEEHDHIQGQPHAMMWVMDIGDINHIQPLSNYTVNDSDSPYSRMGRRFGAHQFQEHLESNVVCVTWFSGGLRLVDISDPTRPAEAGFFIPEPAKGYDVPQSNDVDVDERGLIYLLDRLGGLDILEYTP